MKRSSPIGINHFKKINWLPVKSRVDQCFEVMACDFKNNLFPAYMSDIHTLNSSSFVRTRRSVDSFEEPIYIKKFLENYFYISDLKSGMN